MADVFSPSSELRSMMGQMSMQPEPGDFTRSEVQDILDAVQLEVGHRYADTPDLCEILQSQLRQGIEDCNLLEVDPMQVLHEQLRGEQRILDAYNKHRLGKAAYRYYKDFPQPEGRVDYNEEENIPEQLEWFPLRRQVANNGFDVVAPPIYQVPGTIAHNQEFTAKLTVKSKPSPKKAASAALPSPLSSKKNTGRAAANYDKLADAPSAQLDFPDGNLTLAEITAFLPQSLKSWDVIDRALWNGALSVTLAGMLNHFRQMPNGPIENNSVYRMMKGPMDKRALENATYKDWSVAAHQNIKEPDGFDPASVSVAGFRTPINHHKREAAATARGPVPTILFRDLANGVKVMPTGCDALDLTRCVRYCVAHPEEDWYYPQHFEELVSRLPQDPHLAGYPAGPAPVQRGHQDASIVRKYTSKQKMKGARQNFKRQRDSHGRLLKMIKTNDSDSDNAMDIDSDEESDDEIDFNAMDNKGKRKRKTICDDSDEEASPSSSHATKRKKWSPKTPSRDKPVRSKTRLSRLRNEVRAEDIESDSDSDTYRGSKRQKKVTTSTRSSGRTKRFSGSYDVEAALQVLEDDESPYAAKNSAPKKSFPSLSAMRMMGRKLVDQDKDDEGSDEDISDEDDFEDVD